MDEATLGTSYSKYGVTVGRVSRANGKVSCGIVSAGWPSLALAAWSRGLEIGVVIMLANAWVDEMLRLLPGVRIISKREGGLDNISLLVTPTIWFCDAEPL